MRRLRPHVALALLVGCGRLCGESGEAPAEQEAPSAAAETGPFGVVEGVVTLAEGAALPSYSPEALGRVGPGKVLPEGCPGPTDEERVPVTEGEGRGLAGMFVSASEFGRAPAREPVEHRVTIRGCRLTPFSVLAARGDRLIVTNESSYPFLPKLGKGAFMQAVLKGQSRTFELDQGGVFQLNCGFAAGCGLTDVVVNYHGVHALSGEGGRFRIEKVPAGTPVKIHAWHPLFEEKIAEDVKVSPGRTTRVTLVVTPRPAPPSPAPPPDGAPEGPAEDQGGGQATF